MSRTRLQRVAEAVRCRAQRDGYVVPRNVREELTLAGLADGQWKDVLALVGPSLACRHGRYYYVPAGPSRMRLRVRQGQKHHQQIDRLVRKLIREQEALESVMVERRSQERHNFVLPVEVQTEDHRRLNFLTREISASGMRLVGNCSLQGQKVCVWVPQPKDRQRKHGFLLHVLWSAPVGDSLFENGGAFLELVATEPSPLKIAGVE